MNCAATSWQPHDRAILGELTMIHSHAVRKFCPFMKISKAKDGFTQNPVTAYDPAYGQRQSSHKFQCPYPGEFSRFRPASGLLKIVLSKPDCRCCR